MRIEFSAGQHIDRAAVQLVEAAKAHGSASGAFNGVEMTACPTSTAGEIVENWSRDMDASAVAREAEIARLQEVHNHAMQDLISLDWSDDVAVLDWVCRIQDATDHIGVVVRGAEIVGAFASHGFDVGANCGAEFRPDVRDNVHRYIVGQALDNLAHVGAIHGVIHKFSANWKRRFCSN